MRVPIKLIVRILTLGIPAIARLVRQRKAEKKADEEMAREKARREGH